MKEDSRFRQKVFKSIEDMPWSGKMTGGMVKSTGVFIHEDGTGGYWMEFDWGDEEEGEKNKSNRHKILYSNNLQDNNLNSQIYREFSNIGVQADNVIALMGTFYNHKKEKSPIRRKVYYVTVVGFFLVKKKKIKESFNHFSTMSRYYI